jgi:hypothetical protein
MVGFWTEWNLCQQCTELLNEKQHFAVDLTVYGSGPCHHKLSGCDFCQALSEILDWQMARHSQQNNQEK